MCKICNFFVPLSSERKSFNAVKLAHDVNSSQIGYAAGAGTLVVGTLVGSAPHYSGTDMLLFWAWPYTHTAEKQQVKLLHTKNLVPNRLQVLLSQRSSLPNKQAFSRVITFLKKENHSLSKINICKSEDKCSGPQTRTQADEAVDKSGCHPIQNKGLKRDTGALLLIQSLLSGRSQE